MELPAQSLSVMVGRQEALRGAIDALDPARVTRRALFVRFPPPASAEAMTRHLLDLLAQTLLRLWPSWLGIDFSACRDAAEVAETVHAAATRVGLSPAWAESAARRARIGLVPRLPRLSKAAELAQLAAALGPTGLALIADVATACEAADPALVLHGLDWIARHLNGPVIALFVKPPPDVAPCDRFLHGARRIVEEGEPCAAGGDLPPPADQADAAWIAPWVGEPHPLSDAERRMAAAIRADAELAPLFAFNRIIRTAGGSTPRVDLLWADGRLVVELDGFADHGRREAFAADRHRDWELAASGYQVLRLTNDEVALDLERAVEKIRDLVRLRSRKGSF
jgi:very-short-patch-repair endonuclease